MKREKKQIWGWAMYDWANSAFATTVMAGFFPIFFKEYWSAGTDVNVSTAQLGLANSIASLIVALMAPILGAIADKGSAKKKFLIFFAYLGALMTAGLFLVQQGDWAMAIFVYVMGIIGFSGANTFYDSLLPSVTTEKNIDRVSGLGFGMGYLGGGVLFALNVAMTLYPEEVILDHDAYLHMHAMLNSTKINEIDRSFEVIKSVGQRGHYLAQKHTRDSIRGFQISELRDQYEADNRFRDPRKVALERFKQIEASHRPQPLPGEVLAELDVILSAAERDAKKLIG